MNKKKAAIPPVCFSPQTLGQNLTPPVGRDPSSTGGKKATATGGGGGGVGGGGGEEAEDAEPELEELCLSLEKKEILKETWKIIYSQMGYALSYVGGHGGADGAANGGVAETFLK